MKNRLVAALIAAVGLSVLLAGCSTVGALFDALAPDATGSSKRVEESHAGAEIRDEPAPPAAQAPPKFSLPVSSDTSTYGVPWEVGEYRLLTQPEGRAQGVCSLAAPDFSLGTYTLKYLNEDARQLLAERSASLSDLPECSWILPDSLEPYDEKVIGLVQISVTPSEDALALDLEGIEECIENSGDDISDCGKADRSKDVFECKSWDDGQYSVCGQIFGSTGSLYNASGNFNSAEEGEKILAAFLEAMATPTFPN